MKYSTSQLALLLVAAFVWNGSALGLDCACEVSTGACTKCCGSQTSGSKHCRNRNGPITPPAVMSQPADAIEVTKEQPKADHKTNKQDKIGAPGKSVITDKAPKSTGKIEK